MKLEDKTVDELKQLCKKKKISGYSKLLKKDLIKVLSKKMKGGVFNGTLLTNHNKYKKYSNNIQELSSSNDCFIAFKSDNLELFNRNSNLFMNYHEPSNNNGVVKKIFKTPITVNCRIKGSTEPQTGKVIMDDEDLGFIIINTNYQNTN